MSIEAYDHLIVHVPAKGYGTMEFGMSPERRTLLVEGGRLAMKAHDGQSRSIAATGQRKQPDMGFTNSRALATLQLAEPISGLDVSPDAGTLLAKDPDTESPRKWALLIGIDTYHYVPSLRGCVNDVTAIRELLVNRCGYDPGDITMLTNTDATRRGILDAFDAVVANTAIRPVDSLLLYYSGHGSQSKDESHDEEGRRIGDFYDETIVPCDSRRTNNTYDMLDILDDEIAEWLGAVGQRTRQISIIFDSCNSGTATRFLARAGEAKQVADDTPIPSNVRRVKRWDGELPGWLATEARSLSIENAKAVSTGAPTGGDRDEASPTDSVMNDPDQVFISACQAEEQAQEQPIGPGGRRHGVLTWHILQTVTARGPISFDNLFDAVNEGVTRRTLSQHPKKEGGAGKRIAF